MPPALQSYINRFGVIRMSAFRSFFFVIFVVLAGCSSVGTVTNYRRDAFRLAGVAWSNPKELRFWFCDNVALFWLLDTHQSYLLYNQRERLSLSARPGYNDDGSMQGIYLYISRADKKSFKAGFYDLSLVLDAHFPEYPHYKSHQTVTGAFTMNLKRGLFLKAPNLQP